MFDNINIKLYNKIKDDKGNKIMATIGVRKLAINTNILDGYNYIKVYNDRRNMLR